MVLINSCKQCPQFSPFLVGRYGMYKMKRRVACPAACSAGSFYSLQTRTYNPLVGTTIPPTLHCCHTAPGQVKQLLMAAAPAAAPAAATPTAQIDHQPSWLTTRPEWVSEILFLQKRANEDPYVHLPDQRTLSFEFLPRQCATGVVTDTGGSKRLTCPKDPVFEEMIAEELIHCLTEPPKMGSSWASPLPKPAEARPELQPS